MVVHLAAAGVRTAVPAVALPPALEQGISEAYARLGRDTGRTDPDVAVRSSATAEDLPEASFAGQQESR
ncbi:PEP/pyruvate-binding domain-containing protein [Streptacidiphilus sp. EB129]|uniref:PEP/pyruvate-binding domain-containing protein n=1 Tax=Streptacidiphilus sp. EB129 TaxID=3156262 RepID=UPI003517A8A6